uniref:Uncharacterized protein n=1 Tax=Lygus hesperus TaxID=30085 RepID=A0A146KLV7_LYGHE
MVAMMSNSTSFISELERLTAKLPKSQMTRITIQARLTCDCDGKRMSPCPARCAYSCFVQFEKDKAWRSENDCSKSKFHACRCYEGSSEVCDAGVESCFKYTTGQIEDDKKCSAYNVDDAKLVESFLLIQDLLLEPINAFTRRVESRSSFLKLAADSIAHLSNLTAHGCFDHTTPTCKETSSGLLKKQIEFYQGLKINLTNEMMEKMDDISNVQEDIVRLKEKLLTHVNGLIKGYACCLGAASFSSGNIECPTKPLENDSMPPILNIIRSQRANVYGPYEWVPSNGSIPENAVAAGVDSDSVTLYAGRAVHDGSILPAKIKDRAYVSFDGQEFIKSNFEVLVSNDTSWKYTDSNTGIPDGALQVGTTKEGTPLYMGRAMHSGSKTPGKILSDGCLYIPYGNAEHVHCSYEILVLNKLNE